MIFDRLSEFNPVKILWDNNDDDYKLILKRKCKIISIILCCIEFTSS